MTASEPQPAASADRRGGTARFSLLTQCARALERWLQTGPTHSADAHCDTECQRTVPVHTADAHTRTLPKLAARAVPRPSRALKSLRQHAGAVRLSPDRGSCPRFPSSTTGQLSGNGLSTNFVVALRFPTPPTQGPAVWVLRGTAALTQLDD